MDGVGSGSQTTRRTALAPSDSIEMRLSEVEAVEAVQKEVVCNANRLSAVENGSPLARLTESERRNWIEAKLSPWREVEGDSKDVEAAISQMADVFVTRSRKLDLGQLRVSSLPDAIRYFGWLRKLVLPCYGLPSLSAVIGTLTELRSLDLERSPFGPWSCKGLKSLPDAIGSCGKLRVLNLSCNKLTILPDSIGQLESLRVLNVSCNKLSSSSFPKTMQNLKKLEKLDLSHNMLGVFPEVIGKCRKLRVLRLGSTGLVHLSDEISTLTKLEKLDLSHNRLTELPGSMRNLKQLQRLCLLGNRLTFLSNDVVGELSQLKRIELDTNEIASLPHEIGTLKHLKEIHFTCNPLFRIPMALANLPKLELCVPPEGVPEEQLAAIWTAQRRVEKGKKLEETKAYRWLLKRHPEEARTLSTLLMNLEEGERIAYAEWLRRLTGKVGFTQAFQEIESSLLARWPSRATKAAASAQAVD